MEYVLQCFTCIVSLGSQRVNQAILDRLVFDKDPFHQPQILTATNQKKKRGATVNSERSAHLLLPVRGPMYFRAVSILRKDLMRPSWAFLLRVSWIPNFLEPRNRPHKEHLSYFKCVFRVFPISCRKRI